MGLMPPVNILTLPFISTDVLLAPTNHNLFAHFTDSETKCNDHIWSDKCCHWLLSIMCLSREVVLVSAMCLYMVQKTRKSIFMIYIFHDIEVAFPHFVWRDTQIFLPHFVWRDTQIFQSFDILFWFFQQSHKSKKS